MDALTSALRRPRAVEIDWRAYFKGLCDTLGEPVPYRGKLLFANGLTYSATDFRGPEWAPPDDPAERNELDVAYWLIRRRMVSDELRRCQNELHELAMEVTGRHGELMMTQRLFDEETGKLMVRAVPLDLETARLRIKDLQGEISVCDEELAACVNPPTAV